MPRHPGHMLSLDGSGAVRCALSLTEKTAAAAEMLPTPLSRVCTQDSASATLSAWLSAPHGSRLRAAASGWTVRSPRSAPRGRWRSRRVPQRFRTVLGTRRLLTGFSECRRCESPADTAGGTRRQPAGEGVRLTEARLRSAYRRA